MRLILSPPSRKLVTLGVVTRSWMSRRPEKVPEFGACNVTVVPLEIWTFPSIPAVPVVRMIVQDVHLRRAFA